MEFDQWPCWALDRVGDRRSGCGCALQTSHRTSIYGSLVFFVLQCQRSSYCPSVIFLCELQSTARCHGNCFHTNCNLPRMSICIKYSCRCTVAIFCLLLYSYFQRRLRRPIPVTPSHYCSKHSTRLQRHRHNAHYHASKHR